MTCSNSNSAASRRANHQPSYRHVPRDEYLNRAHEFARHGADAAQKLTQQQARTILQRRATARRLLDEAHKLSNTALGEKYGITAKAVGRIINGHRWRTGTGKSRYGGIDYNDALTMREAARERDRLKSLAAEHSIKKIAAEYGVSESLVEQIGTGRRWVYLYAEKRDD